MSVRVGLLDSGLGSEHHPVAAVYVPDGGALQAVRPDPSGHGADMARIIRRVAPQADFLLAQIFDADLTSTPARVAAGLAWCAGQGAQVVAMCLGLTRDEPLLRAACARAASAGLDLVASASPRGRPVFPAAYPGVISVCGDARCTAGQLSALGGAPADFGACNIWEAGGRRGASCAAASVTGLIAAWRATGGTGEAGQYLRSIALFEGRERRSAQNLNRKDAGRED